MAYITNKDEIYELIYLGKKNSFLKPEYIEEKFRQYKLNENQIKAINNVFNDIGIIVYGSQKNVIKIEKEIIEDNNGPDENDEIEIDADESLTDNSLKLFIYEASKIPLLTKAQEQQLAKAYEAGDKYAKELLVLSNMRLVISIAKVYGGRGIPIMDLINQGYFGLKKAIEKFDYRRGYKLSTLATWWIRQTIIRFIGDNGRSVRIPIHIKELYTKYSRVQMDLWQELGREPNDNDIAERMNLPIEKIVEIKDYMQNPKNLNGKSSKDDTETEEYTGGLDNKNTPDKVVRDVDKRKAIDAMLDTLTPKEAAVIRIRYGLLDGKARTLEETGEYFHITRERVRQIENKAIRKLQHPTESSILKDYIDNDD